MEARLATVEEELQREGRRLPNTTHPDAPIGEEENANVLRVHGSPRAFDFPVRDHLDLATALDMVDFDRAASVRAWGRAGPSANLCADSGDEGGGGGARVIRSCR